MQLFLQQPIQLSQSWAIFQKLSFRWKPQSFLSSRHPNPRVIVVSQTTQVEGVLLESVLVLVFLLVLVGVARQLRSFQFSLNVFVLVLDLCCQSVDTLFIRRHSRGQFWVHLCIWLSGFLSVCCILANNSWTAGGMFHSACDCLLGDSIAMPGTDWVGSHHSQDLFSSGPHLYVITANFFITARARAAG